MPLTLRIREVLPATPRARIVRLDLNGQPFPYHAGTGGARSPATGTNGASPTRSRQRPRTRRATAIFELLIGVDAEGTAGPHLTLDPGELVDVDGPLGTFTFPADPAERRFVFIAGGTGIAPLRAMLRHALHVPHREVGLFYSARTPVDFAYEEEFRALARDGRIELRQTVTREAADDWNGTARADHPGAISQPLVHDPRNALLRLRAAGARRRHPEDSGRARRRAAARPDRRVDLIGPA